MVVMGIGACAAFLLMPPARVVRDDGTRVATIKARGFVEELQANLEIFKDWKLLIMVCRSNRLSSILTRIGARIFAC